MKILDSFWGNFWLFHAFLCLRAGLFFRVSVCSACGDESVRHGECADDVRLCYPLTIHPFLSVLCQSSADECSQLLQRAAQLLHDDRRLVNILEKYWVIGPLHIKYVDRTLTANERQAR